MEIKMRLIKLYEEVFTSNLVLSLIYKRNHRKYKLNIMNSEDTIKYVMQHDCSIARFGEGELELILYKDKDLGFQKHSDGLAEKLKMVLNSNNERLLICIPYAFNTIWGRTKHSRMFWYSWVSDNDQLYRTVELIRDCNKRNYLFGDTQISRPYVAFNNYSYAKRIFHNLKELWKNKDIIIIEGIQTRLGVGNDLFESVKSIKRVLAPAVNAFDKYEEILHAVVEIYRGELILIALGPTATVLAYDLCKHNMRALDIGHIDIEYEWFLRGKTGHEIISGKYTNEASGGNIVEECLDKEYLASIVKQIY